MSLLWGGKHSYNHWGEKYVLTTYMDCGVKDSGSICLREKKVTLHVMWLNILQQLSLHHSVTG